MTTPPSNNTTDILVAIARLETKLDNLSSSLPPQIADHERRLRLLEKRQWPLPSLAVLVSIAAIVAPFFIK